MGFDEREMGGIDVLVNNAVHQGVGPSLEEVPDELLQAVIAVNVLGYYRCAQGAARLMIARGTKGAIVNISSFTADRAVRGRTAYAASKGAIDALTRAMAVDLAPHGIRVNTVAPVMSSPIDGTGSARPRRAGGGRTSRSASRPAPRTSRRRCCTWLRPRQPM